MCISKLQYLELLRICFYYLENLFFFNLFLFPNTPSNFFYCMLNFLYKMKV